ncbi:hypothetical protein IOS36_003992 [Salmonella enterica]|nr:hypothetical protein [Salmonella enterica]EDR1756381.1 hypothetical protein [Salmonella enterica subsp. arizonae]EDX3027100.1 hypothetical protein [Salmonella enterica subsp. houtenae serovar 48:g,z51:-]MBA3157990.1 hypothetical protein [Salmonella enterica subsp. arizonae serovar 48:z4,z24:-]EAU9846520.1 hypothetical protein [Salmonella enterica]
MTTITNNKLTDERVSNATLIRLIQWADQHNSHYVAAALCELQERRKADSAEPACYALTNMAGEVYNTHSSAQNAGAYRDLIHQSDDSLTLRVTPLYTVPPAPVVPEGLVKAVRFYEQVKRENPPVETGAWKDAVDWVLKEACKAVSMLESSREHEVISQQEKA